MYLYYVLVNLLTWCSINIAVHVVEKVPEVADSLCVGQSVGGDERVILFLKMNPGNRWFTCTRTCIYTACTITSL